MDVLAAAETFCGQHHGDKDHYAPYPGQGGGGNKRHASMLPAVLLGVLSAYVSWGANAGYPTGVRVLSSVLAFLFGGIYLLYYVLFGMWCRK